MASESVKKSEGHVDQSSANVKAEVNVQEAEEEGPEKEPISPEVKVESSESIDPTFTAETATAVAATEILENTFSSKDYCDATEDKSIFKEEEDDDDPPASPESTVDSLPEASSTPKGGNGATTPAGGNGPLHHARRPMNAFLIFCKRHRAVVRDRYPHLENRSITKILGEWWANLDPQDKGSYTELARQYKEAFLRANPDFKWYKLPAPPLRTLMTRPSNQQRPHRLIDCQLSCPSPITPGKLADESQMGGLSSLLATMPSSPLTPPAQLSMSSAGAPLTPPAPSMPMSPTVPKPPKKRYLEETMGMLDRSAGTPPKYKLPLAAETRNGQGSAGSTSPDSGQVSSAASPVLPVSCSGSNSVNSSSSDPSNLSPPVEFSSRTNPPLATYPSPFTKLRSYAQSEEQRANRSRRNMQDAAKGQRDVAFSKIKSNLLQASGASKRGPAAEETDEKTVDNKTGSNGVSGGLVSLETTIKASQQQIIDRVVDRLCRVSEQPTSGEAQEPNGTNQTQQVAIETPSSNSPSETELPVPKTAKEDSDVGRNIYTRHKKFSPSGLKSWRNFDRTNTSDEKHTPVNINNNVYTQKADALSTCEKEDTQLLCKTMECYVAPASSPASDGKLTTNSKVSEEQLDKSIASQEPKIVNEKCNQNNDSVLEKGCKYEEVKSEPVEPSPTKELESVNCKLEIVNVNSKLVSNITSEKDTGCSPPTGNSDLDTRYQVFSSPSQNDSILESEIANGTECVLDLNNTDGMNIVSSIGTGLITTKEVKTLQSGNLAKTETVLFMPVTLCSSELVAPVPPMSPLTIKTESDDSSMYTKEGSMFSISPGSCESSQQSLKIASDVNIKLEGEEKSSEAVGSSIFVTALCPETVGLDNGEDKLMVLADQSSKRASDCNSMAKSEESVKQEGKEQPRAAKRPKNLQLKRGKKEAAETKVRSPAATDSSSCDLISPEQTSGDITTRRKSLRACKGKRYMEFMNEGRLVVTKRNRKSAPSHSDGSGEFPRTVTTTPQVPAVRRDRMDSGSSTLSDRADSVHSDGKDHEMDLPLQAFITGSRKSFTPGAATDTASVSPSPVSPTRSASAGSFSSKRSGKKYLKFGRARSTYGKKMRKMSETSDDSFSDSSVKKRFKPVPSATVTSPNDVPLMSAAPSWHSRLHEEEPSPNREFNLDEKIEALPSLSLDAFQLKKKAKKKRSTFPITRKVFPASAVGYASPAKLIYGSNVSVITPGNPPGVYFPQSINGEKARAAEKPTGPGASSKGSGVKGPTLVGSQKRKARKQSITHLDSEDARAQKDTAVVEPEVLSSFGLATLAEVASSKSKLFK